MSLRQRLIVGVLVLAALALVGADIATYTSLRSFLLQRTDSSLETDHRAVESALQDESAGDESCGQVARAVPGVFFQLRSRKTGRVLCSTSVPDFSQLPAQGRPPQSSPQRPPPKLAARIAPGGLRRIGPEPTRYFDAPAT